MDFIAAQLCCAVTTFREISVGLPLHVTSALATQAQMKTAEIRAQAAIAPRPGLCARVVSGPVKLAQTALQAFASQVAPGGQTARDARPRSF